MGGQSGRDCGPQLSFRSCFPSFFRSFTPHITRIVRSADLAVRIVECEFSFLHQLAVLPLANHSAFPRPPPTPACKTKSSLLVLIIFPKLCLAEIGDNKHCQCKLLCEWSVLALTVRRVCGVRMLPWGPWWLRQFLPSERLQPGLQIDTFLGEYGWKVLMVLSLGALTHHSHQALQFIQQVVAECPQEPGGAWGHAGDQQRAQVPTQP